MSRFRTASILALTVSLVAAAQPPGPAQSRVVAIAGLLSGSTIVPLGQFVDGRWVRTWPTPDDDETDRKITRMAEIPYAWYPVRGGIPKEWFVWTDEIRGAPVRVKGPTLEGAHCQGVWGLATRLTAFGHETTAIATSTQSGVRPFEWTVGPSWDAQLNGFLREQFDRAEIAAIRTTRKDADTVLAQRPACEPRYISNCATLADGRDQLCAFEASRLLGTKPPEEFPECLEKTVVQGWYRTTTDGPLLLQISGTLTDCDAKELRSVTPAILIDVDGGTFVVAKEHGYEDESFAVFELRARELVQVLEIPGGGC
jgi:hypothetical protein